MSSEEAKRRRVSDLLRAKIELKTIKDIVGVSLRTVYRVKQAMPVDDGVLRKPGSGGANIKRDTAFLETLKAKIASDPTKAMRKVSKELKVDPKTIRNAVKKDLGLRSYTRTPRHLLTQSMKIRRLERCKKVLKYVKTCKDTVLVFSDEKIFTVDAVLNRRNDRYLAKSTADVQGTYRTKHPAQVMVFGVIGSDGKKMPPYFFKPGEKIGADVYYKVLRYQVLPWLKKTYPGGH